MIDIQELLQRAKTIKEATQVGENTAERVGGVLTDIVTILGTPIRTSELSDGSVTTEKIANKAVTLSKLNLNYSLYVSNEEGQTLDVYTNTLGDVIISLPLLDADGSVSPEEVEIPVVTTSKNGVMSAADKVKLDALITTDRIKDNAITTAKLIDKSITTDKLSDSSVTTEKLANKAVTSAKLADGVIKNSTWDNIAEFAGFTTNSAQKGVSPMKQEFGGLYWSTTDNEFIVYNKADNKYYDEISFYGGLRVDKVTICDSKHLYVNITNNMIYRYDSTNKVLVSLTQEAISDTVIQNSINYNWTN